MVIDLIEAGSGQWVQVRLYYGGLASQEAAMPTQLINLDEASTEILRSVLDELR